MVSLLLLLKTLFSNELGKNVGLCFYSKRNKAKHISEKDRLSTAVLQSLEAVAHSHSFIRPIMVLSKLSSLWLASRTD